MSTQNFAAYGGTAAKRFLKTAIVIDDHISAPIEPNEAGVVEAPDFATTADQPTSRAAEVSPPETGPLSQSASDLPIKPLADAFLDKRIVCGVLKPVDSDNDEDVISRAVQAAEVADIVIVDWYLRSTDNKLALSILSRILAEDKAREGRLRLILVYTSAIPLQDRQKELAAHLKAEGIECNPHADDDTLIEADNCRIRFVQKRMGTMGSGVEDLPGLAVAEFSQLSNGLLSNFALLGVGALRDATHHLLATFDRRLDPAFVGHRMMLCDAEGARSLAMALFMLQIKGILSLPNHLGSSLSNDELGAWFDDRFDYANVEAQLKELGQEKAELRKGVLKDVPNAPAKGAHLALFLPDAQRSGLGAAEIEQSVSRDFARLSTFVREPKGFNPLPADWLPTLTLGSVVKQAESKRFFMCVQPLCDTVRIKQARYFPFIELVEEKTRNNTENLVLHDEGKSFMVKVNAQAGSRHYDKFAPGSGSESVRAMPEKKESEIVGYSFTGDGGKYLWLGDVDAMKAQRIAVDLSGTLARVGIDEYEWLRRGGAE